MTSPHLTPPSCQWFSWLAAALDRGSTNTDWGENADKIAKTAHLLPFTATYCHFDELAKRPDGTRDR